MFRVQTKVKDGRRKNREEERKEGKGEKGELEKERRRLINAKRFRRESMNSVESLEESLESM